MARIGPNVWTLPSGMSICLLTPEELAESPDGQVLWSILGERKVVGEDHFDGDTRFGHTAYGFELNGEFIGKQDGQEGKPVRQEGQE